MNSLEDIRNHFREKTKNEEIYKNGHEENFEDANLVRIDANSIPSPLLSYFTSFFLLGVLTLILFVILFALGIGRNFGFVLTAIFLIIAFVGYGFINLYNVLKNGYQEYKGVCISKNYSIVGKKPKSFVIETNDLMIDIPISKKNIEIPINCIVKVYAPANAKLTSLDNTTLKLSSIYTYELISVAK